MAMHLSVKVVLRAVPAFQAIVLSINFGTLRFD